jgi:hypothetical protein
LVNRFGKEKYKKLRVFLAYNVNPGGVPFIEIGTTIVMDGEKLMTQKATANGVWLHFLWLTIKSNSKGMIL